MHYKDIAVQKNMILDGVLNKSCSINYVIEPHPHPLGGQGDHGGQGGQGGLGGLGISGGQGIPGGQGGLGVQA